MKIDEYFSSLNEASQKIFSETIQDKKKFGEIHHISAFIYDFSECLFDVDEKNVLRIVSTQLDTSALNMSLGMYRQAFTSLRLALEMSLGVIYFSINKLEHYEWLKGQNDIKWSKLIDKDNGVLSRRFANAFFPELSSDIISQNGKAKSLYRELSEFVHGNYDTWDNNRVVLEPNQELIDKYFDFFERLSSTILLVLCCRYLKSIITSENIDQISGFLLEEMKQFSAIREALGGVKEEK